MKKISLILVVAMLLTCMSVFTVSASAAEAPEDPPEDLEPITLKFGHYYAKGNFFDDLSNLFADTVEELSGGVMKVDVYTDSVLGNEEQLIEGAQGGTVDLIITGTLLQTTVPMLGIVQGPFLFENWEHAKTVMNGELGKEIYDKFEDGGMRAICTFPEGFREFVLVKPIRSMEDFKGYQMRMGPYQNMLALAHALGCAEQTSPMVDVFTSLQTGVYDGCDAVYTAITAYAWYEPANYVLETHHSFSSSCIAISSITWDKLSDAQKAILEEASAIVSEQAWAQAEEVEQEHKQAVIDEGVEIIEVDDEWRAQMKEATWSVWEDLFASVPGMEDLYNRIQAVAPSAQ